MKLKWHLLVIVALSVVPLLLLTLALIWWSAKLQQQSVERGMQQTVSAMAYALDQDLRATAAALQGLAAAGRSLDAAELVTHADEVRRLNPAWASVVSVTGRGRTAIPLSPAGPAAELGSTAPSSIAAATSGRPAVSNLYQSAVLGTAATAVHVPLDAERTLGAIIPSAYWTRFLQSRLIPPGWVAGIIDRDGVVVARSRAADQFVGKPAPPWVKEALRKADAGQHEGPAFEGQRLSLVFHRSGFSGWTVAFAAPTAVFEAPLRQAITVAAGAGALFLTAAGALVFFYARRVVRPLAALTSSASGSVESLPVLPASPVLEFNDLYKFMALAGEQVAAAAAARSKAEAGERHAMEMAQALKKQEQLELAARELERANALKSQFLANMSHELRTPLNAIIGFSELMKDGFAGPMSEKQQEFTREVLASGRHLLALINDILDLSKVEAGMMTLELQRVEVRELLQASAAVVKENAQRRGIKVSVDVEPDFPPFSADPRKLKQVVFNLVANAVKFCAASGRVRLTARRLPREAVSAALDAQQLVALPLQALATDYCEIEITDTGSGIAAADLHKLFRPFVQIDSTLSRQHEGTGLGLALVKNMVELHGGTIGVRSEPGKGSTFTVWVPMRPSEELEKAPRAGPPSSRPGKQVAAPLALVVEDADDAAVAIEMRLRSEGFEVARVYTAEEGLFLARRRPPTLITLDVFLPHMDGWDFLRALRHEPQLAGIPVVLVTIAADAEHGYSLGATRVLHKPFTEHELKAALDGLSANIAQARCATVLVAEDNPHVGDVLASTLTAPDLHVMRAHTASEAVETVRRSRVDLIVFNLLLPQHDGFAALKSLQQMHGGTVPIIVLSSIELSAEEKRILNDSVLRVADSDGFAPEVFRAEVRRALKLNDVEATGNTQPA